MSDITKAIPAKDIIENITFNIRRLIYYGDGEIHILIKDGEIVNMEAISKTRGVEGIRNHDYKRGVYTDA